MARTNFLSRTILAGSLGLGACAPSPLYVDRAQVGTYGEVPRDGRGEPIWSAIRPAPVVEATPPATVPSNPG